MDNRLRAGVGRATITPPIGVDLMGYSRRSQPSVGIHMDLYVTALVAAAHGQTVAILDCDLIYLHPPLVDEIRDSIAAFLETHRSHVLLACSHSHSAPTSSPVKIGGEQDRVRPEENAYIQMLPHLFLSAVRQASARLQPARIKAGMGHMDFSVNRREKLPDGRVVLGLNDNGPADYAVGVVRIDSQDGRPIAAVVNYTCHPIFIGSASRLISPDYPGPLRRTVERETGATCLFLQGATGNMNPRSPMHPDVTEAERAGTMLGLEAAKVFLDLDTRTTIEREAWITSVATFHLLRKEVVDARTPDCVGGREVALSLPLSPLPDATTARSVLRERQTALEALLQQGATPDDLNPARYQVQWAQMLVKRVEENRSPESVTVPVQVVRINDVAVVGVASELFVEAQLAIKRGSPFPSTLVAAYANGCVGYIPVADAYPDGGYEVEHSYKGYRLPAAIAPGAAEKVTATALNLLRVASEKDASR
jgi:neutral ceramidase